MTGKRLPYELRSLVHHVELNRSGWWDKALQQLILYALWLEDGFSSAEDIDGSISTFFSITVETERLVNALQSTVAEGRVIENFDTYKITEEQRTLLEGELDAATQIAERAKGKFILLVSEACPSIDSDKCWEDFNQRCLLPLVMDLGARTYEFLLNRTLTKEMTAEDTDFFANYERADRESLQNLIVDYLSPDDAIVRDFLLRTLDAAFFIEASGLQSETLEKLASSGLGSNELTLFLDTNLLFSVMELHDNPSNQSVNSLLKVIRDVAETIPIKLYALPVTLGEFRRTLTANRDDLANIVMGSNIVAAARLSQRFSGVKLRYFEKLQESSQSVSPDDYFDPYLSNPVAVMRENGVELFNVDTDLYDNRQDVIDGINDIWESEREHRRTNSRYRAIEYDMVLWHFVHDRRPAYTESFSDAQSWVVTIDYSLLRYDRDHHNQSVGKPVCIHPSMLVQMLRFWLPRDDNFETAVLDSLRIPFIFRSFDSESEKVTLRILKALTRFELGDISPATLTQVLVDDAVNTGFRETNEQDAENDLIEHGLSTVESELLTSIGERASQAEEYRGTIEVQNDQLEESARFFEQERQKRQLLQDELDRRDSEETTSQVRRTFLLKWIAIPSSLAFIVLTLATILISLQDYSGSRTTLAILGLAVIGTLAVTRTVIWRGSKVPEVSNAGYHRLLRRFQGWINKTLWALLVAVLAAAIWDMLNTSVLNK